MPIDLKAISEIPAGVRSTLGLPLSVRLYGAVGDGVTDDTAAFQAAIDAIGAMDASERPALFVPASSGRYWVTSLQVDFPGLVIVGAGRDATCIDIIGSTVATYDTAAGTGFNLGTFDDTLADLEDGYVGVGQGFTLRDLTLIDTQYNGLVNEGSRRKFAIQDNGGGGLRLSGVTISGFAIGISLPYCSDLDVFHDVRIVNCDTGVYLGPLANQFSLSDMEFLNNAESLVIAGAPKGEIRSCWFIDSNTVDIAFEANTATRSGLPQAVEPNFEGNIEVANCWHETGVSVGRAPSEAHVWVYGDLDDRLPRNMKLRNPFVVAGGTLVADSSFLKIDSPDTAVEVDRPMCWGTRLDFWVQATAGNPTVILRDPASDDTATITDFDGTGSNALSISSMSWPAFTAIGGGVGFTNSWTDFGAPFAPAGFRKSGDGKQLQLVGVIVGGTNATSAFTLPATHRPTTRKDVFTLEGTTSGIVKVQFNTDGTVVFTGADRTRVSLDLILPLDA